MRSKEVITQCNQQRHEVVLVTCLPPPVDTYPLSLYTLYHMIMRVGIGVEDDAVITDVSSVFTSISNHGVYNSVVLLTLCAGICWFIIIGRRIFLCLDILRQLHILKRNDSGSLFLEGMASFTEEFRMLQRNHFNLILRAKKTVTPCEVPKVLVKASV
eukprot:GHVQ01018401.1.p1 GENE.GHVQ01018401.1~~GHVQ01018401.1.p1  ORF type:complete len:158 (+),score=10.97 GHVQ01018401.1:512-985(+)